MAGIMIEPIATTVATLEPEIAANLHAPSVRRDTSWRQLDLGPWD